MDNLKKEDRSKCMSHIRNKWTLPERKIHFYLKSKKIKHKMHPKIKGSPDIFLSETNTVVFLHGCFWHKCQKCFKMPNTNRSYWLLKINRNKERDKVNEQLLKRNRYKVIKIWEHQIKNQFYICLKRLIENGSKI